MMRGQIAHQEGDIGTAREAYNQGVSWASHSYYMLSIVCIKDFVQLQMQKWYSSKI